MKIAFLSFYSGEVYRGVETYVHCLANELVKLGHVVVVYQNGPEIKGAKYRTVSVGLDIDWKQKSGSDTFDFFTNYWVLLVRKFTRKVLKELDKNTDVLISTNGRFQTILCSWWTKKHRKKLIVSGQSGPGRDDRFNLLCFPDVFVSLTEHQKKWAQKVNKFVKTIVIPNGADIPKFANVKKAINFDLPKPIILSVGALVPFKRHHLIIDAVSKVSKGSLVLVGKGELQNELQKQGNEKLPGRFKILSVSHDEIPSIYKGADLFTFATSPWESFGIVLVEAMASGLPVVASDDPIRREIVGDAGIFVDPRDSDAYSKAIEKALSTKWGDQPRKQVEKFGWDKIAREYEKLFRELT